MFEIHPWRVASVCVLLSLAACSGGGGGSNTPPPAPPVTDNTPPETTISTAPAALSNQRDATFAFSSTESGTFEASLDDEPFAVVSSPISRNGLADGSHTLRVRARDTANNVDASPAAHTWTIDTVPPVASITSGPPPRGTSSTATIIFTTEPGSRVEAYGPTNNDTRIVTSPLELTGLTDGPKFVSLRAIDAAGNMQLIAAEYQWLVDTTPPTASIQFPTAVSYTDESDVAVRVTATDADAVASVRVNGVAATLSGGAWLARVPVAIGDNALVVSTTDALGNQNPSAASVSIANRGPVIYDVGPMVWDAAGSRILLSDSHHSALIALRGSDGRPSILTDATHGTGPAFVGGSPLALDAANHRVLTVQGNDVIAIDLVTGNRTIVVASPPTAGTTYLSQMVCAVPCSRLYVSAITTDPVSSDATLYTIDLATGARNIFSGGDFHLGAGVTLKAPTGLVFDNAGGPRLIATETFRDVVVAIDVNTGDRTVLSSSSVGAGVPLQQPVGLTLDAANNRVFVADLGVSNAPGRLFAVDLTSGNRTTLAAPSSNDAFRVIFSPLYDAPNNRVLLAQWRPASIAQVNLASQAITRFADSFVGDDPRLTGDSLALDTQTNPPTLVTSGVRGLVRVHPTSGERSAIATTTLPMSTATFSPRHIQFDTRAGAPAGQMIFGDNGVMHLSIYRYSPTGTVTTLVPAPFPSNYPEPEYPLDAANNRLIVSYTQTGVRHVIAPIDLATGSLGAPLADSPVASATFGHITAMAIDVTGGMTRLLAADDTATLHAFSLANGARSVVSSAAVGAGPALTTRTDGLWVDVAGRAAYLVSSIDKAVLRVDLLNGDRTLVSGAGKGKGPTIEPYWPRITADTARQLAYVTSNGDTLLAVDLVTGERVITSR